MSDRTITEDCPACGWLDDNSERPACPTCDSTGKVQIQARRVSDRMAA